MTPVCLRLDKASADLAETVADLMAGITRAANPPTMAITTRSSTKVKALGDFFMR